MYYINKLGKKNHMIGLTDFKKSFNKNHDKNFSGN